MLSLEEILVSTKGSLINGNINTSFKNVKIDSRSVEECDLYIPIIGEKVDGHIYINDVIFKGCNGVFLSKKSKEYKNISKFIESNKDIVIVEVNDTVEALYNMGLYNRDKHDDVEAIGITGSVGKTSTREMIASVFSDMNILTTEKNMNGNIGLPIMALRLDKQELAILEAGIDFTGEMKLLADIVRPEVAVITNIGTSHIEKFGSIDTIYEEKIKIADKLRGKKKLLLNRDDEYLAKYKNSGIDIIYFGIQDADNIKITTEGIEFDTYIYNMKEHIKINDIGNHNIINAIAAIKIAEIYNVDTNKIIEGIAKYTNFSRRMERIKLEEMLIIDDTYNASPNSTKSGLETVSNLTSKRKIAVLADILELGKYSKELHEELGRVFKNLHFDSIIVFGENMKYLARTAKKWVENCYIVDGPNEAEKKLREIMKQGDVIYFKGSNITGVNTIVQNIRNSI